MTNFDSVERLRERAHVSYEDAKAALDACGGDLLDALIYLERQGKVSPPSGGSYSSKSETPNTAIITSAPRESENREGFKELMHRFFEWCGKGFHYGTTNYFEVCHKGEKVLAVPVIILVLLLIFAFWITIPLMIVGLFLNCRYSFRGAQVEKIDMNGVMDSAAAAADKVKGEVKAAHENYQHQQQQNNNEKKN